MRHLNHLLVLYTAEPEVPESFTIISSSHGAAERQPWVWGTEWIEEGEEVKARANLKQQRSIICFVSRQICSLFLLAYYQANILILHLCTQTVHASRSYVSLLDLLIFMALPLCCFLLSQYLILPYPHINFWYNTSTTKPLYLL